MHRVKNEQGHTLLLTLILSIILVLFFSTVSLGAINQQKQVKHTDSSFEATAIAEMGLEYYRAIIIDMTNEQGKLLRDELRENEKKFLYERETEVVIRDRHLADLSKNINKLRTSPSSNKVDLGGNPTRKFELLLHNNNSADPKIINNSIPITIRGTYANKQKTLSAIFKIPDNFVVVKTYTDNEGPANDGKTHLVILPTKPTNVCTGLTSSLCIPTLLPSFSSITYKKLWIENNLGINFDNGNSSTTNHRSVLYLIGNSTFLHTDNSSELNIYSSQNLTFSKKVTLTDSLIEAAGMLNITPNDANEHKSFSSSRILAEGLTINTNNNQNYLKLMNGSKLCLRDKSKAFNLDRIEFVNEPKSYVYILSTTEDHSHPNIKYVLDKEFKTECWLKDYVLNSPTVENFATEIKY